jgi:hypothetical protein
MGKILIEPAFWIAAVGLIAFVYWSRSYIVTATLIFDFMRTHDNDPLVQKHWPRLNNRNASYFYSRHNANEADHSWDRF